MLLLNNNDGDTENKRARFFKQMVLQKKLGYKHRSMYHMEERIRWNCVMERRYT